MFSIQQGYVKEVLRNLPGYQEIVVIINNREAKAISYPDLTGEVRCQDLIWLNTTAVELKLGTGGYHFVMGILGQEKREYNQAGHIMKLRYTPWQFPVLAVEEEDSPNHERIKEFSSLQGTPVIVGTLHSMVVPALLLYHLKLPEQRAVYIMTDGAALPIRLSHLVRKLKEKGLITQTITCGHAFGGDLEAVNIYSALVAAKMVGKADLIIVAMGPGIVGTGTKYGFSGVEQAYILEAVERLGGLPIAIPRISFTDPRARHQGLSHHSQTILGQLTYATAHIGFPRWNDERSCLLAPQIRASNLLKHYCYQIDLPAVGKLMEEHDLLVKTMGRSYHQDPAFFDTAAAAGILAAVFFLGKEEELSLLKEV